MTGHEEIIAYARMNAEQKLEKIVKIQVPSTEPQI